MSGSVTGVRLDPDKCKCGSHFASVMLEVIIVGDLALPSESGAQRLELADPFGDDEIVRLHSREKDGVEWTTAYCARCVDFTEVTVAETR
jgi:hypothetical protein